MKISKHTRLGIFIVFTIAVFIWGLAYLKGHDLFSSEHHYFVLYDRVDGLEKSCDVSLNGYPIGKVKDIKFTSDNSKKLLVTLAINADLQIPRNTTAKIASSGLLGARSVVLLLGRDKTMYQPNDTLRGSIEGDLKEQVSQQILPLKNKSEELLGTIDSAVTILTSILDKNAQDNLSSSFSNLNQTVKNLEATTAALKEFTSENGSIRNIVTNIDSLTTTFKNNTGNINATLNNLHTISDTLAKIQITPLLSNVEQISEKLLVTLDKLNSENGTAGLLLNDKSLYNSINMLSQNLAFLINDIKNNPKRYLQFSAFDFGKEIYVNTQDDLSSHKIVFKVLLKSSRTKLNIKNDAFKGFDNVEEYYSKGVFYYLIGNTGVYSEITTLYNSIHKQFPNAKIIALKRGKIIKMEKAMKSIR